MTKYTIKSIVVLITFLMLTGCNLKIHIFGEGTVRDLNGEGQCAKESCTYRNNGDPKRLELIADPAPGYTAIGILAKNSLYNATDGYHYYTHIGINSPDILGGSLRSGQGYDAPEETVIADPLITYPPVLFHIYKDEVTGVFLPTDEILEIKTTNLSKCVLLTGDRIECWGSRYEGEPDSFNNISKFETSSSMACTLDDSGLQCWGSGINRNEVDPDSIENVIDFVLPLSRGCALHETVDGNKVSCWGYDARAFPTPELINPRELRLSDLHSRVVCAIDDTGEVCWGEGYWGQEQIPSTVGVVTDFSVAANHTCAITEGRVECWGQGPITDVPEGIVNPQKIETNTNGACVTDASGVTCWGNNMPSFPAEIVNPLNVMFNNYLGCVDTGSSLLCESYNGPQMHPYASLSSLTVGSSDICFIDNGSPTCLRVDSFQNILNELVGITDIAFERNAICHLSQSGLGCYEQGGYDFELPNLTIAANDLLLSPNYSCALETRIPENNTYFECWGNALERGYWSTQNRGQLPPAVLPGIYDKIEAGYYHTCALSDGQLSCWGSENPPNQ